MMTKRRNIFLISLMAIVVFNLIGLWEEFRRIQAAKKFVAHQIIGEDFSGLTEFTKGIPIISYYTDADLETNEDAAKQLSHAQYMLAPTILDTDDVRHEYILLVTSSVAAAWKKMKELGAEPMRGNEYGMILARRKIP